jgi:hypothetical protein
MSFWAETLEEERVRVAGDMLPAYLHLHLEEDTRRSLHPISIEVITMPSNTQYRMDHVKL